MITTQPTLSQQQIDAYQQRGFVLGPKVLDDARCDELCEEVERVIRDRERNDIPQPVLCHNLGGNGENFVWQIVNIWMASDAFRSLLMDSPIPALAAQLSGASELRIWHDQIQHKPPRKGGVNWWHQDSIYWPPLMPKDQQITAWIALDDAAEDNGCMSMVPGSQLWGDRMDYLHGLRDKHGLPEFLQCMPPELDGHEIQIVTCPVPRGAVHFHHALTWHGSRANTSGRPRRAIALHFACERTTADRRLGNHPMNRFFNFPDGQKLQGEAFPQLYPTR